MTRQRAVRGRRVRPARPTTSTPRVNLGESPLAWLASRKDKDGQPLLSREQFEAGERLRRDFTFAHLGPRVTASWSPVPAGTSGRRCGGGPAHDMADNVIAARQQVNRALTAVGPDLSGVLLDVCCFLKGLESVERKAGWPQRSGKIVLTIALQQLARHYGLVREAGTLRGDTIRHWGADGYRPSIGSSDDAADEG